ncbi:multicopper oxidase domain-containing protein [Daeguia caeni]|uniref:Multicopper oxidase domain-containing protein n=1 Tax=Daeguia caeni TaxID=439612 RepID=A0ABV9H5P9_9HYPH
MRSARRIPKLLENDGDGRWLLHCHHLYHMATGMMTCVDYEG